MRALSLAICLATFALAPASDSLASYDFDVGGPTDQVMFRYLRASGTSVAAYDMKTEASLEPIRLDFPARTMAADAEAVYLVAEASVRRVPLDGSPVVREAYPSVPHEALVSGELLLVLTLEGQVTVNRTSDLRQIGSLPGSYALISEGRYPREVFAVRRHDGAILRLVLSAAGEVETEIEQPEAQPWGVAAAGLFPIPGDRLVVSSGVVLDAETLGFAGVVGGNLRTLAANEGAIVLARGGSLERFDPDLAPHGVVVNRDAGHLHFHGASLFLFAGDSYVEVLELGDFAPRERAPAVDSRAYRGLPDRTLVGADGIVYLRDNLVRNVLRYSLSQRRYLEPIRLDQACGAMALWPEDDSLVLACSDGILRVPLGGPFVPSHIAGAWSPVRVLQPAGQHLLVHSSGFGFDAIATLTRAGDAVAFSTHASQGNPAMGVWDPTRAAYFVANGGPFAPLRRAFVDDDGNVGPFAEVSASRLGSAQAPGVWLSDDPAMLVSDSGQVFSPDSLVPLLRLRSSLIVGFDAVVWTGGWIYGASTGLFALESVLRRFSLAGEDIDFVALDERLLTLAADGDALALVTHRPETGPVFRRLSATGRDLDGDLSPDVADFHPLDAVRGADRDRDGVSDRDDDFPDDLHRASDADGDGYADPDDAFPFDASEWSDLDGDGWGDNRDALPEDPDEQTDFDRDGVGDNGDAFPDVAYEQRDADDDGTGDRDDAFPLDPAEWRDTDEDGIGNLADPTPFGVVEADGRLVVALKIKLRRFYPAKGRGEMLLYRFGGDRFALCVADAADCMTGRTVARGKSGRKLALELDALSRRYFTRDLDRFLTESLGWNDFSIVVEEISNAKLVLSIARDGRSAKLSMRVPHRAHSESYGRIDGFSTYKGGGPYGAPSP